MLLLIIRHADAGDSEEFAKTGQPDHLRPLSKKGRKQMRTAVKALMTLVPETSLIVTSPFARAVQTEEIIHRAYGDGVAVEMTETLEPDRDPDEFERWLRERDAEDIVAVGHEPHLATLVTWLMTGTAESRVQLKKGGACLMQFEKRVTRGDGTLRWLLTPKQLEAIARA